MTASRLPHSTSTTPTSSTAQQLHPGIDLNPSTGASILQAHLEACFKRGQLSDVKVRVDRFGREYRLHKVVLAQAAFFSSLFTGGWSEEEGGNGRAQPAPGAGPSLVEPSMGVTTSDGGREINLQMDDPNISRAAFEILLSRLYSTGPPLFVSPITHPTPLHPLSPSFSQAITVTSTSNPPPLCPDEAQPATPRFLLSLLATSLFLGLPGVTQGVLGLIIGSMSPWSVGVYLGFAIGKGVGGWGGEEWEIGEDGEIEEKGGRGLEDLGVRVEESVVDEEEVLEEEKEGGKSGSGRATSASKEGVKTESPSTSELPSSTTSSSVHPNDRSPAPSRSNSTSTPSKPVPSRASLRTTSSSSSLASSRISALRDEDASSTFSAEQQLFFYGPTSNRIGEACACWLARWSVDILAVEEKLYLAAKRNEKVGGSNRGRKASADASKGKGKASTSSASPSSYFPFIPESSSTSSSSRPRHQQPFHPHHHNLSNSLSSSADFPPIFSLGGLPAPWLRAVISSDAFFVKNEMERYRVAKRVYDLRRAQREAVKKENGGAGDERRGSFETESEMEEGEKEEEEEEAEFEELFAKGIYYSHMTFEELAIISHDINPSTSLPYAPLAILQTSNWSQQELKTRILSSASPISSNLSSSPNSSTSSNDLASAASAELGISSSTTGIVHDLGKVLEREARRRRRSRSVSQSASSPYSPSNSRPFGSVSSFSPYGVTPSSPPSSAPLSPLGGGGGTPNSTFSALSLLPPVSSSPSIADTKLYWPVPGDDTHRIGDYGGFLPLPPSGLATTGTTPLGAPGGSGGGKKTTGAAGEREFFGVGKGWRSGREILEGDLGPGGDGGAAGVGGTAAGGEQMWTKYEPFRFSVEFWGVDKLKEKQREYSNTVFYAGSYFNVYAQTIKKKDRQIQLGIYLHRQSMLEPTPVASAPPVSAAPTTVNNNPLAASQSPASPPGSTAVLSTSAPTNSSHLNHIPISRSLSGTSTPIAHSPSISPPSATSSGFSIGSGTSTPANVPSASFRDPRKVIKCYFSISCPSALGTALTRFSSAPDVFSVSQSWGWKSQSLRSEEYLSVLPSLMEMKESIEDGVMGWTGTIDEATFGKLQSLRATVVVGLV